VKADEIAYFRGNVFVANLPPEFTDDDWPKPSTPLDGVESVDRPRSGKRQTLRYGFVDIADRARANRAVAR